MRSVDRIIHLWLSSIYCR